MIIDCHTHWGLVWEERDRGDATNWLRVMDRHGVNLSFLYGHANLHRMDWCAPDNTRLAEICRRHPKRLLPVGSAWLQTGDDAVEECRRCLRDLGMAGLKFHPWLQGASVCQPVMDRICELAAEYQAPIFFHDGTPTYSNSEQIAELAMRHPATKIVLGHSGLLWQWRHVLPFVSVVNLYFCLCGPAQRTIELLCSSVSADRLIWGSDFGFGFADAVGYRLGVLQEARVDANLRARILGENALRLLPPIIAERFKE